MVEQNYKVVNDASIAVGRWSCSIALYLDEALKIQDVGKYQFIIGIIM